MACSVILESKKDNDFFFLELYLFSVGHIGTSIKTLTEKVEKTVSNHRNVNKPVGGINVAEAFIKKELKEELKVKSFLFAKYAPRNSSFNKYSIIALLVVKCKTNIII